MMNCGNCGDTEVLLMDVIDAQEEQGLKVIGKGRNEEIISFTGCSTNMRIYVIKHLLLPTMTLTWFLIAFC